MRLFSIIILTSASICACQPPSVYHEEESPDWFTAKNDTIKPYGTYFRIYEDSVYKKVACYISEKECLLYTQDSGLKTQLIKGTWLLKTNDTQFFSFDPPFNKAFLSSKEIHFFDTATGYRLLKKSDTLISELFN